MVHNLGEAVVKVKSGSLIGLDREQSIEMLFIPTTNRLDLDQKLAVGEYLVVHCQTDPRKDRINQTYIELQRGQLEPRELAKAICAYIFDKIVVYALKQLDMLSIRIPPEDLANCKERCWEELVDKLESHIIEVKEKILRNDLFKYVKALGMYLTGNSLTRTSQETGYSTEDLRCLKVSWAWDQRQKGLENLVKQVVMASFDIERRVDAIKVSHYSAPIVDLLGREAISRLQEDMSDIPTEKVIKLFNEVSALHAKLTGQQETPDAVVNIGIANVFKKLEEIDTKQLPDVRSERQMIE